MGGQPETSPTAPSVQGTLGLTGGAGRAGEDLVPPGSLGKGLSGLGPQGDLPGIRPGAWTGEVRTGEGLGPPRASVAHGL